MTQLVELQEQVKDFEKNDIWVCAISYDPVDVLGKFAEKHAITYPLLSDVDSAVIRRFGILNTTIPEDHSWHGVPFPGAFMADEQGAVIEKSFYANHGIRDSVARMLQDVFQVEDAKRGMVQTIETESVKATACLSSRTIRPGQVLTFTANIEIKQGRHIYGHPLPDGYIPTTLMFQEIEGVHFGDISYPEPRPYHLKILNETLPVYDGRIVLKTPIRNGRNEAFIVRAYLEYQACDERDCYLPDRIEFALPLDYLGNVRD